MAAGWAARKLSRPPAWNQSAPGIARRSRASRSSSTRTRETRTGRRAFASGARLRVALSIRSGRSGSSRPGSVAQPADNARSPAIANVRPFLIIFRSRRGFASRTVRRVADADLSSCDAHFPEAARRGPASHRLPSLSRALRRAAPRRAAPATVASTARERRCAPEGTGPGRPVRWASGRDPAARSAPRPHRSRGRPPPRPGGCVHATSHEHGRDPPGGRHLRGRRRRFLSRHDAFRSRRDPTFLGSLPLLSCLHATSKCSARDCFYVFF